MYIIFLFSFIFALYGFYSLYKIRNCNKQYLEAIIKNKKQEIEERTKSEMAKCLAATERKREYEQKCLLQEEKYNNLKKQVSEKDSQLSLEVSRLNRTKKEIDDSISSQWQTIEKTLEEKKKLKEESISKDLNLYKASIEEEKIKYKEDQDKFKIEIEKEINDKIQILEDFQTRCEVINQAMLREKQIQEQDQFYSINISDNDKEDIQMLSSMDIKLHNRNVIPKLIWEIFVRRPVQEMEKRVLEGRKFSGIYKITYKKTGEAYIGKSTDISTRWINHMKTVFGVEGGCAKATIHTRMLNDGFWNYTFEVLEEVPKDKLGEREAFYIDLYGTKNQLNMKEGNKSGINRTTEENT